MVIPVEYSIIEGVDKQVAVGGLCSAKRIVLGLGGGICAN